MMFVLKALKTPNGSVMDDLIKTYPDTLHQLKQDYRLSVRVQNEGKF